MPLQSQAQEFIVVDPSMLDMSTLSPSIEIEEEKDHHHHNSDLMPSLLEVDEPVDIEIVVEELPGAKNPKPIPEPVIEVKEEDLNKVEEESPKNNGKWDWQSKITKEDGTTGFIAWIKERIDSVPTHSGVDTAGIERAQFYLEKLDGEISKAMRLDLEGAIDANKVEQIRADIDNGISRLQDRLEQIKSSKKSNRKKKSDYVYTSIIKEAQKITGVQGIYVVAPLFISRIARVCINSSVSAGHDIESVFADQVKKYDLTEREQVETIQLMEDMGYYMRHDRGYKPDEDIVVTDGKYDWASNYKG